MHRFTEMERGEQYYDCAKETPGLRDAPEAHKSNAQFAGYFFCRGDSVKRKVYRDFNLQ